MSKCVSCKINEAEWAFQPFGPDEKFSVSLLGWHYRGFAVIKLCNDCKDELVDHNGFEFDYQGNHYIMDDGECVEVPPFVSDALAWLESQS